MKRIDNKKKRRHKKKKTRKKPKEKKHSITYEDRVFGHYRS
jgi:hypothetical protein